MSIWRWADFFSRTPSPHRITLGEGNTPLVQSRRIGPRAGLERLYFKLESVNPTGSYKDRYAAAAISDMIAAGKTHCVATSSGNTGSALAAYCAAVGMKCEIAIVDTAPPDKLKQMMAYGADIFMVRGFGRDAQVTDGVFKHLQKKAEQPGAQLQISAFKYSPAGMAGVQTIGYELASQAQEVIGGDGSSPHIDHVFVQAGGGGLTLAVARGFAGLVERSAGTASDGEQKTGPAIHCVQPKGNNTIAGPLRDGEQRGRDCQCTSEVSGLQVAHVIDGHDVIPACRASGGTGHLVSDEFTWATQSQLGGEEGIFCEPAGAVSVAGALQAAQRGLVRADDVIVCVITGIGFKDAPSIDRMIAGRTCPTYDLSDLMAT